MIARFSQDLTLPHGELIGTNNEGLAICGGNRFGLVAREEGRELFRVIDQLAGRSPPERAIGSNYGIK